MADADSSEWTGGSVPDFLAAIPNVSKREDARAVVAMMEEVTGEVAEMADASTITFGRFPTVDEDGEADEGVLVGFGPRKRELVLYILPGVEGYGALLEKLGKHKARGACLYIKRLSDVDLGVLRELVADSVAEMRRRYTD